MRRAFVNGVFDVLHPGHLSLLKYARAQADWLCVGIDSDRRVRERKGTDRPLNTQQDRAIMLSSLRCVDEVKIFDSDQELEELVKWAQPHIMVVGSDYRNRPVIGSRHAKKLEYYERIPEYSSTAIIDRMRNR